MNIAVVGLGYVGLPLAHQFALKGIVVFGYDTNPIRIDELKKFKDSTKELDSNSLQKVSNKLFFTNNIKDISKCNYYIITVPTPIDNNNQPDLSALINSSSEIAKVLKKNDIVIYESTVYPGVTEEVCVPTIEKYSNLKYNKDFFVGYSPERINPGDKVRTISKIIKVTSGSTPETAKKVDDLYKIIIDAGTHLAKSIKIAEASKVIENTQRDINIAVMNELSIIFDNMNIDTNEVLEAASTKWNFLRFKPGLVGGHCIGVDPYYLSFKSQELGYKPNLILLARQLNNSMSKHISDKTIKLMIENGKIIRNSNIIVFGVTFKENCPDLRNSKVFDIIDDLLNYHCKVDFYDPHISKSQTKISKYNKVDNPFNNEKKYDAALVAVPHDEFLNYEISDFKKILNDIPVVIDIKGIIKNSTWKL